MNKQEAQISYTHVEKEYFSKLWNKVTGEIKSQTTRSKKRQNADMRKDGEQNV